MGETERYIRAVKERVRVTLNTLPFRAVLKRVIIKLVYLNSIWLNTFPAKIVISKVYSPRDIVYENKLEFKIHCRMELGDYAKVNDDPSPTNSMKSRARIVLGLEPQVNIQCSYKFLGMTTGKKLKKRAWKPMPMPDTIIKIV